MPHRINSMVYSFTWLGEFAFLGLAAVVSGLNNIIDEQSWDRLTGRHGALFVMAIALLVFWNSNRLREKRDAKRQSIIESREDARRKEEEILRQTENAAREDRHREAMELQRRNSDQLITLNAESIKAQAKCTHAIEAMDKNIQRLTMEISDR